MRDVSNYNYCIVHTPKTEFLTTPLYFLTKPDISIAIPYAKSFAINGQDYLVLLQNRVNPRNMKKVFKDENGVGEYWISPTETDIRPYGLCIKRK